MGVPASRWLAATSRDRSFIPFLFLVPAVLRWGFTDLFEHLRIAGLRLLLATFDELDNKAPLVPVVEQEQHFGPYGGERLGDGRPFHALRISSHAEGGVVHVGEQFV